MQAELFDFGLEQRITDIRDRLLIRFGPFPAGILRRPIDALIKSIISSRTRDDVSRLAFDNLVRSYPDWSLIPAAGPKAIEAAIAGVTFADAKASHVIETLNRIAVRHPDFDLDFLAAEPLSQALVWLQGLPGVGPKVAAAAINFSTLERPAFVVDTHVLRVLKRFGVLGAGARNADDACDLIMPALAAWSAVELSDLHCLVKHLGQTQCHAGAPVCADCPLTGDCAYLNSVRR